MKNIKIMGVIISILFIVFITIYINKPYDDKEYLNKNFETISVEDNDFKGLDIMSKDLKNKKIVLTGESHGLDKNYKMMFKMLKYLQEEIGVKYLIIELGQADAYFLNKYLESGDEKILKDYYSNYPEQKTANEGKYELFKNIYEFNQTLTEDKRIKVIGVDINTGVTDKYILDIIKDKGIMTNELEVLLNELEDFNYYAPVLYKGLMNKVDDLLKDIKSNPDTYIKMFGDDFEGFEYAIRSLGNLCKSFTVDAKDKHNLRDSFMYKNFKEIDDKLHNPIYFGQFGGAHIYQDTIFNNSILEDVKYFGTWLNSDEKYKGKILSIQYGYYSNKSSSKNIAYPINEDLFKNFLDINTKDIIFKLNNIKSPYKRTAINPFDRNLFDYKNTPTANYYEYIILLKDAEYSKALDFDND